MSAIISRDDWIDFTEQGIPLPSNQAMLPGIDLETLPLFSGTPMQEPECKATVHAQTKQAGFFSCQVCFDTGTVMAGGKAKRCWCKE